MYNLNGSFLYLADQNGRRKPITVKSHLCNLCYVSISPFLTLSKSTKSSILCSNRIFFNYGHRPCHLLHLLPLIVSKCYKWTLQVNEMDLGLYVCGFVFVSVLVIVVALRGGRVPELSKSFVIALISIPIIVAVYIFYFVLELPSPSIFGH